MSLTRRSLAGTSRAPAAPSVSASSARESDDALLMMMIGLVMVGAVETNESAVKVTDVTPVARLIGEPEIIVVRGNSPYGSLEEFVKAWKEEEVMVG